MNLSMQHSAIIGILTIIWIVLACVALAPMAKADEVGSPIRLGDDTVGRISSVELQSDREDPSKLLLRIGAKFDSFARDFDRIVKGMGNMGSCSDRFFWIGNTKVRSAGSVLTLTSRARYEKWACMKAFGKPIKSRLLRITRSVNWHIGVNTGPLDAIELRATVDDIKNFPNWIEGWFGHMGTKFKIPIPENCGKCKCTKVQSALQPNLKNVSFVRSGESVRMDLEFSLNQNLAGALQCM